MHNIWKELNSIEITEQRMCDQARMIKKNEWITKLELENRRRVLLKEKNIEVTNNAVLVKGFIRMKRIYVKKDSTKLIDVYLQNGQRR